MNEDNAEPGRESGRTAIARIRDNASARIAEGKDHATQGVATVAEAARQTTRQLRDQHHDSLANYVEKAADQLERFSSHLKERNVAELVDDVQQFARRRPAVFIGSAFAVGFVCSRLLKQTAPAEAEPTRTREFTGHEWTEKLR
jgi:ElaB/YqjD/DUF883 family membrane-anchored ribosome-binding protein